MCDTTPGSRVWFSRLPWWRAKGREDVPEDVAGVVLRAAPLAPDRYVLRVLHARRPPLRSRVVYVAAYNLRVRTDHAPIDDVLVQEGHRRS